LGGWVAGGGGCGLVGEGWAIGIPAGYQPLIRGGLADGEPRAAGGNDAAAFGCGKRPRGGCGGALDGEVGQGREGPGERGGGLGAYWKVADELFNTILTVPDS